MNLSNMKQLLIQIWAWVTALLFIVVLLSPFIILIGIPVLIEELWKEKY